LARNLRDALPNAAFIGFTGTPIEAADRNTRAIFGEYIDVYDLSQAVEDGATVRVYYEARLAKVEMPEQARTILDEGFDDVTELTEVDNRERLKSRWQSNDRLHESTDMRRLVQRHREATPRVALRRRREGQDQSCHHRVGSRRA
jgi:type I restriction enzyme R subunit